MRTASITRNTAETQIEVSINLDGTGAYDNQTGVGFFDHMLDQLSRHSLIDMTIRAAGDLHIDDHHTVEDVGITLGQAFAKAVASGRGRPGATGDLPATRVMLTGHLGPNPGPAEPWGFDFRRAAFFEGLGAVGYTRTPILTVAPAPPRWLDATALRLRLGAVFAALDEIGDGRLEAGAGGGQRVGQVEHLLIGAVRHRQPQVGVEDRDRLLDQVQPRLGQFGAAVVRDHARLASIPRGRAEA